MLGVFRREADAKSDEIKSLVKSLGGRYVVVQLTDLAPVDGGVYFDDDGVAMIYGDDADDDVPVADVVSGSDGVRTYLYTRSSWSASGPGSGRAAARIWGPPGRAGSLARLSAGRYTGQREHRISAHTPDVEDFVANIKSQIKRIRTNEVARLRNKSVKSALKTSVRRFREAADSGDRDRALAELQTASRQLDKAASKGVIHANQAANKKSAMAQRANAL